jgi:hypothetical protein
MEKIWNGMAKLVIDYSTSGQTNTKLPQPNQSFLKRISSGYLMYCIQTDSNFFFFFFKSVKYGLDCIEWASSHGDRANQKKIQFFIETRPKNCPKRN